MSIFGEVVERFIAVFLQVLGRTSNGCVTGNIH